MIKPNAKTRDSRLSKIQQKWIYPPSDKRWVKFPLHVLGGEAWRGMRLNERRLMDMLMCEHAEQWVKSNGELQVSYKDFRDAFAIKGSSRISEAKKSLLDKGLITVKEGISQYPNLISAPHLYEITFYRREKGFIASANERFAWAGVDVMTSPEWRGLSINARRVIDRLLIEHNNHKSEANGKLRVSYKQLVDHGISGVSTAQRAVGELVDAGLLAVTKGQRTGKFEGPNLYRLTFHGTLDEPATWPPSNVVPFALPEKPRERRPSFKIVLAEERIAANG
jgi:hypothetical protein